MSLDWTPGDRIKTLPIFIQPFAVLARNVLIATGIVKRLKAERFELRADVYRKLMLGVDYVYGSDVKGDIAEFGTMTGATAAAMAQELGLAYLTYPANDPRGNVKRLHLFDSFRGLPVSSSRVDTEAPHVQAGTWSAGTCKGITKEDLLKKCARFIPTENVLIHDGWFKDTLPKLPANTTFALLHIDCDLYQSTIEVLDFCFSRGMVQEGAAVFFDDWNSNRASPEYGERKAWAEAVERYSIKSSDSGEYGHLGRKFLVHSYSASK
jgi:hypothetical protein